MTFKKQSLTSELINSLTNQQQVQKLYKLNATSLNIGKLQNSLKKYNRLRCLILDFNYIETIENLDSLFDLRELHLEGNLIKKISGLQACRNITVLNLRSNSIEEITNISLLTKLQTLNLSKNKLKKIQNIQHLKQLKSLDLSFNDLTCLQNLPKSLKIQTILLNNNNISSVAGSSLASISKLIKLDISFNKLTDCSFISKLTNIESLNLANNKLKTFSLDLQLKYLQELNLESNQLDGFPLLVQYLPQLSTINLSHNLFCSEHQFITMLSENQMLTEIQFLQNPIYSQTFQNTLFKLFGFERINRKTFNTPGSKYLSQINNIQKLFINDFSHLEDDQEDKKIKLSGFYNDDLQAKMTGIKPHRAISPTTKKARTILNNNNSNQIAKNFTQFLQNDRKIKLLKETYEKICLENNIQKPQIQNISSDISNTYLTQQENEVIETNLKQNKEKFIEFNLHNNKTNPNSSLKQKQDKWSQLKAKTKQKSFNIRKSRNKQINASLTKISAQLGRGDELIKTQMIPFKINNSKLQKQRRTTNLFHRPYSQK